MTHWQLTVSPVELKTVIGVSHVAEGKPTLPWMVSVEVHPEKYPSNWSPDEPVTATDSGRLEVRDASDTDALMRPPKEGIVKSVTVSD